MHSIQNLLDPKQSNAQTNILLPSPRLAATLPIPQNEGYDILVKQRLNRPVSPHLGIYKPQTTWTLSIANRITGSVLSGAFYVFGFGYLVQPLLHLHLFESPSMIAGAAALPLLVKVPVKFLMSYFFTFHSFNGVRHLVWDSGRQFTNQQVIRTGWFVVGLSAVTAGYLTFGM